MIIALACFLTFAASVAYVELALSARKTVVNVNVVEPTMSAESVQNAVASAIDGYAGRPRSIRGLPRTAA